MPSVKKRRLCIIALAVAVCVSLSAVLMIRASAPEHGRKQLTVGREQCCHFDEN